MKKQHKHRFTWGITNYKLKIGNPKRKKVIRCAICEKDLDDIIEDLITK